jgi:hypothetical protein
MKKSKVKKLVAREVKKYVESALEQTLPPKKGSFSDEARRSMNPKLFMNDGNGDARQLQNAHPMFDGRAGS